MDSGCGLTGGRGTARSEAADQSRASGVDGGNMSAAAHGAVCDRIFAAGAHAAARSDIHRGPSARI